MSKAELEEVIKFHRKQMELNNGKAEAALTRSEFHRKTMLALEAELKKGGSDAA